MGKKKKVGIWHAALKRSTTRRTAACYRSTTLAEVRESAAPSVPDLLRWTMARCVKTPTKAAASASSPLGQGGPGPHFDEAEPRRRLGGVGCFRRCAPPRTEGLHDDLDGTPPECRTLAAPELADPPRLMDAIAAYNKLMDAEEALVEVVGLDGCSASPGAYRRRQDRACDKSRWGLDDDKMITPACAECPL